MAESTIALRVLGVQRALCRFGETRRRFTRHAYELLVFVGVLCLYILYFVGHSKPQSIRPRSGSFQTEGPYRPI